MNHNEDSAQELDLEMIELSLLCPEIFPSFKLKYFIS